MNSLRQNYRIEVEPVLGEAGKHAIIEIVGEWVIDSKFERPRDQMQLRLAISRFIEERFRRVLVSRIEMAVIYPGYLQLEMGIRFDATPQEATSLLGPALIALDQTVEALVGDKLGMIEVEIGAQT